jgi:muramoyltetrapeptide carboxypeptidase
MQKVKALREGSKLGVVAPASDVSEDAIWKGVAELRSLGFQVVLADSIFARHFYFAGPHEVRARELMQMFENPEIDAIISARGGYGSIYLLQFLDAERIRQSRKALIGYSDVTVLLQFLEQQCNLVCFHGPMVAREFALGEPAYDQRNFLTVLTRTQSGLQILCEDCTSLRGGTSSGRLSGGCLSLLAASLGTSYEFQTEGKILFLEDVNTKPYQIDRMLMQLKLAGKFDHARGVIFGEMLHCNQEPQQDYLLQDILTSVLGEFDFPVLYGFKSGHTSSGALTLPLGVEMLLDADEKLIQFEEAAVC